MPESFRCFVGLDKPEARQHVAISAYNVYYVKLTG